MKGLADGEEEGEEGYFSARTQRQVLAALFLCLVHRWSLLETSFESCLVRPASACARKDLFPQRLHLPTAQRLHAPGPLSPGAVGATRSK